MKFLRKTITLVHSRDEVKDTRFGHISLSLNVVKNTNTNTIVDMCTTYTFIYTIINAWWRFHWIKKQFRCNPNIIRLTKPSKTNDKTIMSQSYEWGLARGQSLFPQWSPLRLVEHDKVVFYGYELYKVINCKVWNTKAHFTINLNLNINLT